MEPVTLFFVKVTYRETPESVYADFSYFAPHAKRRAREYEGQGHTVEIVECTVTEVRKINI